MRYEAPESMERAVALLAGANGDARVLAGGTDLLVQMRADVVEPELIVEAESQGPVTLRVRMRGGDVPEEPEDDDLPYVNGVAEVKTIVTDGSPEKGGKDAVVTIVDIRLEKLTERLTSAVDTGAHGPGGDPEDLREATQRAAAARAKTFTARLGSGRRLHAKRMASVAAIYTVEPFVRTPEEILPESPTLEETGPARPQPEHKRVWASLAQSPEAVIREMFDEAARRDPKGQKRWVALVDGNLPQIVHLQRLAEERNIPLIIIVDFLHVAQYVWKAAGAFFPGQELKADRWTRAHLLEILRGKASLVAAGMRRSATLREMAAAQRQPVDECADYLLHYSPYLQYDQALAAGVPIATGVIEGTCRHLVEDRMNLTGARWSLTGAEAVLQHPGFETVLETQSDDVKQPFVAHAGGAHARVIHRALAAILQVRVRSDQPARCAALPVVIERRPCIDVAIFGVCVLLARVLARPLAAPIEAPAEQIEVGRVISDVLHRRHSSVPAKSRGSGRNDDAVEPATEVHLLLDGRAEQGRIADGDLRDAAVGRHSSFLEREAGGGQGAVWGRAPANALPV